MSTPATQIPGQQMPPAGPQGNLHPTVTYGQQGGQQAQVIPPGQPFPQQNGGTPAPAQMGPPPTNYGAGYAPQNIPPAPQPQGWGQQQQQAPQATQQNGPWPQQPQQPAPQQWGQQPQAPQQGRYSLQASDVLDGPGVPPELRGRSVSQVMSVYNTLANAWLNFESQQRQLYGGQAPQGGQQAPQGGPQYGQQHASQGGPQYGQHQQHAPQAPQAGGWRPQFPNRQQQQGAGFWDDARPVIREEIQQAIAPVVQPLQRQAVQGVEQQVAQHISDYALLEPEIKGMLAGAPPQALANPEIWVSAADMARGRLQRTGEYQQRLQQGWQPRPQQPQQAGWQQSQQPMQTYGAPPMMQQAPQPYGGVPQWQAPQRYVPAGQQVLPQGAFFVEGPTPAASSAPGFTPLQQWAMSAMGMDPATYQAWSGGVQRGR